MTIVVRPKAKMMYMISFALFLGACASQDTVNRIGVLVVATTKNTVYVGRAHTLGRRGTFTLESLDDEHVSCSGTFRYHFDNRGRARYRCSDNQSGQLRIMAEGFIVGAGTGESSEGPVELVFGYPLKQVNKKLSFPGNQKLVWSGQDILLVEDGLSDSRNK